MVWIELTAALLGAFEVLASAAEVDVDANVEVGDGRGGQSLGAADKLVILSRSGGVGVTGDEHSAGLGGGGDWTG